MNTYFVKVYRGRICIHDEIYQAANKKHVLITLIAAEVLEEEFTKITIEE